MTHLYFKSLLAFLISLTLLFSAEILNAQDQVPASEDTTEVIDNNLDETEESGSIWDMIGQAGPIQYPIYLILIAGVFLISLRSYEFYTDRQLSEELEDTSFRHMSLNEISSKISTQQDFMLSRIMAKLLNVFETNRNADYLHDEISNYNSNQQDNFNTFKNRIDFLSDTAGALGLLGTVWGMFMVFSSGTLEKERILMGMGLALMSTLLGLVVSITLNFFSTLTEGYFSDHLEKVTSKADELRFRLIELSETAKVPDNSGFSSLQNNQTKKESQRGLKNTQANKTINNSKDEKSTSAPESPKVNEPKKIELLENLDRIEAGKSLQDIKVKLMGTLNEPVDSAELEIVLNGKGQINNKKGKSTVTTNTEGIASFSWTPDESMGEKKVLIRSSDKDYKDVKTILKTEVTAGNPENLKLLNNHQAGQIGKQLEKPVSVVVTDKFDNPVRGVNVLMKVTMGNGTFENGKRETTTKTDKDGKVYIDFTLGTEAGFNAIDISLPKYEITKSFQAVGQEVTV